MSLRDKSFTRKGKRSLKVFYINLYRERTKLGYACNGIKKRLRTLGVKI